MLQRIRVVSKKTLLKFTKEVKEKCINHWLTQHEISEIIQLSFFFSFSSLTLSHRNWANSIHNSSSEYSVRTIFLWNLPQAFYISHQTLKLFWQLTGRVCKWEIRYKAEYFKRQVTLIKIKGRKLQILNLLWGIRINSVK